MTEKLLDLPEMFTPERLGKLYELSIYWIAFRVNPADRELRDSERSLLLALMDRASGDDAPAMVEALKPIDPWASRRSLGYGSHLDNELKIMMYSYCQSHRHKFL